MIPEEKIQEIIDKADIVSVISKYAQVQKQGKEYLALCLFHNDSTPSMHISPDKKIFKCFSCGVGGNVISFLQKYKHISFTEAAIELAKEFNVDLGNIRVKQEPEKYNAKQKLIFEINEEAMKYYQALLNGKAGVEAKKYLENRNISKDEMVRWNIGYAYGEDSLLKHLTSKGYNPKDLVGAGVATLTDHGVHDYYLNRVIFPIKNIDGFVTGFSGRVLDDSKPKYVNTRETDVFKKSTIMYNIDEVWKNKERYEYILVLEGFMDVISLNRVDHPNALALMGTNLSEYHLKVLKDMKKPIKLFLDGDEPGVNAMYKNSPKLIENNIPFTIVDNTTVNDPDELVNMNQVGVLNNMIDKSMNVYEYFLKKWTVNKELTVDDKREIVNKIFFLLQYEKDLLTIDSIENELVSKLGFSLETIKQQFDKFKNSNRKQEFIIKEEPKQFNKPVQKKFVNKTNTSKPKQQSHAWTKEDDMHARVFLSLVKSGDFVDEIQKDITTIYPGNYLWQNLISKIVSYYKSGNYHGNDTVKLSELLANEKDPQLKEKGEDFKEFLLAQQSINGNTSPMTKKELDDIIDESKIDSLREEVRENIIKVKQLETKLGQESSEPEKQLIKAEIHKLSMENDYKTKKIEKLNKTKRG